MCIVNAGFALNPKFSVYLLSPSNHFDLTFEQKKKKQNQKIALCAWRKANASLLPYCL